VQKKHIESDNYSGEDRRKHHNLELYYRIGYALLIGAMIIGIYRARIDALGIEQKAQAYEIREHLVRITNNEKDIVYTKTEISSIKDGVQRIMNNQDEMSKDIKKLLSRN